MFLFFMENNILMIVVWFIICLIAVGVELSTSQLVSIWFAGGAFISLILACFNVSWQIQLIVFASLSILLLIVTKPILEKKIIDVHKNQNVNSLVGQEIIITKEVSLNHPGEGKIRDVTWTCKTMDQSNFEIGEICEIKAVNGNSIIITKKGN